MKQLRKTALLRFSFEKMVLLMPLLALTFSCCDSAALKLHANHADAGRGLTRRELLHRMAVRSKARAARLLSGRPGKRPRRPGSLHRRRPRHGVPGAPGHRHAAAARAAHPRHRERPRLDAVPAVPGLLRPDAPLLRPVQLLHVRRAPLRLAHVRRPRLVVLRQAELGQPNLRLRLRIRRQLHNHRQPRCGHLHVRRRGRQLRRGLRTRPGLRVRPLRQRDLHVQGDRHRRLRARRAIPAVAAQSGQLLPLFHHHNGVGTQHRPARPPGRPLRRRRPVHPSSKTCRL